MNTNCRICCKKTGKAREMGTNRGGAYEDASGGYDGGDCCFGNYFGAKEK